MERDNQRVRLTKNLLKESLIAALQTQGIRDISVRELCLTAGINRSTFYKHYANQYELLAEMENELLQHIQKSVSLTEMTQGPEELQQIVQVLEYLEKNEKLARLLINNNVDPDFPQKLLYLPKIQQLLTQLLTERYEPQELPYVIDFVIYGAYHMMLTWINKEQRESAEQIAALLLASIRSLL